MRKYSLSYLMSRSFKGFSRNGLMSVASILILTSCLLVSGSFGLIIYNLYVNLHSLNELNEIVCMCNYEKIPDEQLDDLYNRLVALPNVTEVKFTSREEALANMREKYSQHPQVLDRFNEDNNPFFEIYTISYSGTDNDAVNLLFTLRNKSEFPEFRAVEDKLETANTLERLKNTILWIFGSFMIVLLFISVVIIMNTVRMAISSRSEEIEIMRYIGATGWFISFPFMIESLFTGLISAIIAFILQFITYNYLFGLLASGSSSTGIITIIPFADIWYYVALGFIALSFLTCYIGAKISLSKHIKV